jgi:UDP-N-acetylmuramoyl-tripeptide--D-alanyl-D-alanine ligase
MDERRKEVIKRLADRARRISIDTRTIRKGDAFLAIKGKTHDGHDFVREAFKKGAIRAVVSRIDKNTSSYAERLIKVDDTLRTLGDIAAECRLKFKVPVVAVTGSNGKTTTKDIIAHVLSARYTVLKNESSKNNLIGLPLTLLGLSDRHDVAVLEMGMNRLGEIDRLSEIANPHIGVVTNIGPSHLEFLGTLKKVFIAKCELLKRLSREDTAVLNKDDPYLRRISGIRPKKIYFGIETKCHFQASDLLFRDKGWLFSVGEEKNLKLNLLGKHNIYNALAAIAVARLFGIDFPAIKEALASFRNTSKMRLEIKNVRGMEILDDSYNSNPLSMERAVETLAGYNASGKRIIVCGDMLELGGKSREMHEAVGRIIAASGADILVTMGKYSRFTNKTASKKGLDTSYHADSHKSAAEFLRKNTRAGDVILVKGSRAMQMEKVITELAA